MKKKDHNIRNDVIAILIAAAIIAAVKPLRNYAIVAFGWYFNLGIMFLDYLGTTFLVPLWLIVAVFLILLLLLFLLTRAILRQSATSAAKKSQLSYTSDQFHGLIWRWSIDSDLEPYFISTFCPRCDMQLHPRGSPYPDSTQFQCDKCGYISEVIKLEPAQLEEWVIREIQRKLRTNEWKLPIQGQ